MNHTVLYVLYQSYIAQYHQGRVPRRAAPWMRHRPSPSVTAAEEQDVAFFGAVDTKRYLFLLAVTLQSVARFHRRAGFFVLAPSGSSEVWGKMLQTWTNGTAELIELRDDTAQFEQTREKKYSPMTFHRLRMPEILAARGYAYSVNLDPDVLCVAPWDMTMFLQVRLVAGRAVRPSEGGLPMWAHERSTSSGAMSTGFNNTLKALGISADALAWVPELNGGVLIFNNVKAVRVKLFRTCLRTFFVVGQNIEGDQDLLNVVLASNPMFQVYKLPTAYNFAFQRDRESVPSVLGMRLRLAIFSQLICVHFVLDGKPWEVQELPRKDYAPWLLVARLNYLREWLAIASNVWRQSMTHSTVRETATPAMSDTLRSLSLKKIRPAPDSPTDAFHRSAIMHAAGYVAGSSLLTCRCFLKHLSGSKDSDPVRALRAEEAVMLSNNVSSMESIVRRRGWYHRQALAARSARQTLLSACENALTPAEIQNSLPCSVLLA